MNSCLNSWYTGQRQPENREDSSGCFGLVLRITVCTWSPAFQGLSPHLNAGLSLCLGVIFPLACCCTDCPQTLIFRCSFSNAGREQFPNYPPDGTFLPEIRLQVVELHIVFHPSDQLQNQTPVLVTVTGKEVDESTSLVGAQEGRVGVATVFHFQEYGTEAEGSFLWWGEPRADVWN